MAVDGVIERCAGMEDAELLSGLGAETFIETFGHLYDEADLTAFLRGNHSLDAYRRRLADPAHALWIARSPQGGGAGFAVAGPCTLPAPDMPDNAGELARLYVRRECQGGGLGGALLARALVWLDSRYSSVFLSVYRENLGAQRLYARHGFEKVHEYFFMVGNHADPEIIMRRG